MKKAAGSKRQRMGACKSCFKYTMLIDRLCKGCSKALRGQGPILFRNRTNGEVGDILGFKAEKDGLIPMHREGRIVSLGDWMTITERVARFYENITPAQINKYNKTNHTLRISLVSNTSEAIEGYVYLLESSNGYYKIGRAREVGARLSTIQRSFPVEIKLIHCFRTTDYVSAEKYMHRRYSEYRLDKCEWFSLPQWAIEYITDIKDFELDHSLQGQT